jgi:maltose-binding protein MalE
MTAMTAMTVIAAVMAVMAVMAGCSSTTVAVRLDSYRVGADDQHITVSVTIGEQDSIAEVKTTEDATKVTVDVRVKRAGGTGTDLGVVRDRDIILSRPLAGRSVVDGTGHTVPRKQ